MSAVSPRYVGIDATDPVDTLAWGQHWREKLTGSLGPWQNLVEPLPSTDPPINFERDGAIVASQA